MLRRRRLIISCFLSSDETMICIVESDGDSMTDVNGREQRSPSVTSTCSLLLPNQVPVPGAGKNKAQACFARLVGTVRNVLSEELAL